MAGKGDKQRSYSKEFRKNFDLINWDRSRKVKKKKIQTRLK